MSLTLKVFHFDYEYTFFQFYSFQNEIFAEIFSYNDFFV